jgi:hypothetical protein
MKRVVLAACAAIALVLAATPAYADGFGLARFREQWAVRHPAPTLNLQDSRNLNLGAAREIRLYHRQYRHWLHRAWVAWSKHAEYLERQRVQAQPDPPVASSPGGSCFSIISQAFGSRGLSVSYAYAIAQRESNCNPSAQNSIGLPMGHASGLFQILYPGIWNMWAGTCGYGGSSVFNAVANANVAACMVTHIGWSPWAL